MVVDDQEMICNLVKASLENLWPTLKVHTCSESSMALEKIKSFLPDLVLLDIQMGEVSGGDIAQQMKENPSTQGIPIIFLTGIISADEAHARGNTFGGEHFLAKPIDFKELAAAVEKYIG